MDTKINTDSSIKQNAEKIKKPECVYCNNAPVNHALEFFVTTMDIVMSDYIFPRKGKSSPSKAFIKTTNVISRFFTKILEFLHVVRYEKTNTKLLTSRTKAIWAEAVKRNIPIEQLIVLGKPMEVCRAYFTPKNYTKPNWFYFESLPVPPWCDLPMSAWIDDKRLFNKRFTSVGLPVAKSMEVSSMRSLKVAARDLGFPLIVKPRSGSRARHTSVNIKDMQDLVTAFKCARVLCYFTLVEQFIPGYVYRATCIGKKLVAVLQFIRPTVVADGIMSMRELLEYHNTHKKYDNITPVKINEWLIDSLSHQGFTLDSIPPKDTVITLTEHSERPNGGYFIDVTDSIPEENRQIIEKAARVSRLDVIGFDVISQDLSVPHSKEPLTIIEGNSLPFIELHLEVYDGKKYDTPKMLWDLWFN